MKINVAPDREIDEAIAINIAGVIQPLADRITVRKCSEETMSTGGIVLPEAARERPSKGEIVAVGPGRISEFGVRIPPSVAVGQQVLYAKYAGLEVKVEGVAYQLVHEKDILAVIDEEDK